MIWKTLKSRSGEINKNLRVFKPSNFVLYPKTFLMRRKTRQTKDNGGKKTLKKNWFIGSGYDIFNSLKWLRAIYGLVQLRIYDLIALNLLMRNTFNPLEIYWTMGNTLIHWGTFADAIGMRRFQYFDALFLFESSSFQTINESISKSSYNNIIWRVKKQLPKH